MSTLVKICDKTNFNIYYPTVTREDFDNQGRLTDLIENGQRFKDIACLDLIPNMTE